MKKNLLLLLISLFVIGLLTACGSESEETNGYSFEDSYDCSFSIDTKFIKSMDEAGVVGNLFEAKNGKSTIQFGSILGNSSISLSPYAYAEWMYNSFKDSDRITERSFEKVDGYKYECASYKTKRKIFNDEKNEDELYNDVYYYIEDGLVYYELSALYTDAEASKYEKAIKEILKSFKYKNNEFANNGMDVEIDSVKLHAPAGYYASAFIPEPNNDGYEQNISAHYYHTDNVASYMFELELSTLTGYDGSIEDIATEKKEFFKNDKKYSSVKLEDTTMFGVPAYCVSYERNFALMGFDDEYEVLNYYFQINDKCYQLMLRGTTPGKINIKDFEDLINGIEFK